MPIRELNVSGVISPSLRRDPVFRVLAALPALYLSGCLYTTQHFNTGRLLEPGETAVTMGWGKAHFYQDNCPDGFYLDFPDGKPVDCRWSGYSSRPNVVHDPADSVRSVVRESQTTPKVSLGYRLGVRKQWGPLTGIEIGWSLEAPTNPISLEFDLKAGLPAPAGWKVSHSLSAGWGVGAWVDNTWFAEYAVARAFGKCALFGSYRFSLLATQPTDLDSSFNAARFVPFPHLAHQVSLGWFQPLAAIPIVPDYLIPEITLTAPVFRDGLRYARPPAFDFNFNLGIGWNF